MSMYQETRNVPLSELTSFPGNAKRGDIGVIRESIRRNGQYRSLVVRDCDDGLIILAGNHTYKALVANGDKTARCEIIRCDDDTARRINLVDNKSSEKGSYDTDALVELLSYLDGDYEGTGFEESDVNFLIEPEDIPESSDPIHAGKFDVIVVCYDSDQQTDTIRNLTSDGYLVRVA